MPPGQSVTEYIIPFDGLDDLYLKCVSLEKDHLVDRISIEGIDDQGHKRTLTFKLSSITFPD